MAENIHVDLSEELEQNIITKYQNLCDEIRKKLDKMSAGLQEICNQTQYEPMVKVVNKTIELFYNDIYSVSAKTLEEWLDGDGSFTSAAETSQTGDAAVETAGGIESQIRDIFESFWEAKPLGDAVQIDTSRPKVKDEDFDELKEIYNKIYQEIEEEGESSINDISGLGEDNQTYKVAIPAFKAITEPMNKAFESFCAKIDEAKAESEELKKQQETKNDEASENATQTSASAEEIAESLKMFDDL